MIEVPQWIDGQDVMGQGEPYNIIDPSTGDVIGILTEAVGEQVESAVSAARNSFENGAWSSAVHSERRAVLRRAAESIRDDGDKLCKLQVSEAGMPPAQVRGHIAATAAWFDYYADFLTRDGGETFRQLEFATTLVEREPIGVCALYTPWNVPLGLSAVKLAPALAAGNSIVLKPSEESPMVTRRLVDLIQEAGLPAGVLNYVNGRGTVTGAALANAADIDMVSFTGGHAGGRFVAEAAARNHVPCILELGGKSATIVFEDADPDASLDGALRSIYGNNGEACLVGARIILQESIANDFIDRFRARAEAMLVGDPRNESVEMGPMISAEHRSRVLGFLESAQADGDQVLFGGPGEGAGYFVRPGAVLVSSVRSRIWREEVFGPIAAITTFRDEAEAVSLGNDSRFGLAGYVWTRDINRALRVSRKIRAGTIVINSAFLRELNAPFGGYKASGIGREGGLHSWNNFTEVKATVINHGRE